MCYNYQYLTKRNEKCEIRNGIGSSQTDMPLGKALSSFNFVNGFGDYWLPVIRDLSKGSEFMRWGLWPSYFTESDCVDAEKSFSLLNKTADQIKPQWERLFIGQRCLVPATAFFEWMHVGKNKYPHKIFLTNLDGFYFGGIFNYYHMGGAMAIPTFAILTTRANTLLAKIHNTKKRMPVILNPNSAKKYLNYGGTSLVGLKDFFEPYPDNLMDAVTIRRFNITQPQTDGFDKPFIYPELGQQQSLF